jgi:hypothetical protein
LPSKEPLPKNLGGGFYLFINVTKYNFDSPIVINRAVFVFL